MLTVSALKTLLQTHGLRLTKRLGQNYLIDARSIQRIVEAAELDGAETVVDVGAGLGALTEPLAAVARDVIAIEVDRGIARKLAERLSGRRNVTVRQEDVLQAPWESWSQVVVVGAIPYRITSDILVHLCERRRQIRRAVLVLQREVAQRLTATPGTKAYGRLSVLIQYCWDAAAVFRVPRGAFFPQPKVDSACVRLRPHARPPVEVADEALFFEVVKAAFSHRRKTLANCLSQSPLGIARINTEGVLRRAGLKPRARGETLTLRQFAALADVLAAYR